MPQRNEEWLKTATDEEIVTAKFAHELDQVLGIPGIYTNDTSTNDDE
ncbi:hypothetical protein [Agromyces sp. NPDC057865]